MSRLPQGPMAPPSNGRGSAGGVPQPAGAVQGPPPPAAQQTPQWTKNDDISLARHSQNLGAVNQLLDDGEITEAEHADMMSQIMPPLQRLQQRQQAAQQQAQQQQQQQLMQATAQQQAMDLHNRQYRAQSFKDGIAAFTDPVTGRTAHFFEDKPGHWHEVEFLDHKGQQEATSNGQ